MRRLILITCCSYVPYKYDMHKFIFVGSLTKDHMDPSTYTVLTAKSKRPGAPLTDFCTVFRRWEVADGFRPPVGFLSLYPLFLKIAIEISLFKQFYHRNCAVEVIGMVYGLENAFVGGMTPGGLYYQSSMVPHGRKSV